MSDDKRPITPPQLPRRGRDPKLIGPWKVGRTIGRGASGHVRIARHSKTGKYAAVKIVSKNQLIMSRRSIHNLEEDAERILLGLEREIVVMKLIDHPNVMRLYDVWETSGELFLILEYVEGGELFDYMCERGRLPACEALDYFQQLISAMNYCHRLKIAHRDLKPENLLLDKDKTLKVADFGMAAWQGGTDLLRTSCGSPHYAAPEVIDGMPYDGSISDVWSCGVILFALLAGRLPFDDENIGVLLESVRLGKYTIPSDIDSQAQDLIKRMLERDVQKRIRVSEILLHPWYTSRPPRYDHRSAPSLDDVSRPITNVSSIDPDIFGNLRTLWHGAPDSDIIEGLTNKKQTWEKVVYSLLMRYRTKCQENAEEELQRVRSQRNTEFPPRRSTTSRATKKRQADIKKSNAQHESPWPSAQILARPDPPTPRRARWSKPVNSGPPSLPPPPGTRNLRPIIQPLQRPSSGDTLSILNVSFQSPSPMTPSIEINSPLAPTSPASPIWQALDIAPPLDIPELHDEHVQRYFQQIIDHLNLMQKEPQKLSDADEEMGLRCVDNTVTLLPKSIPTSPTALPLTSDEDCFNKRHGACHSLAACGLGILEESGKENVTNLALKPSLRKTKNDAERAALTERRVQIVLPPPIIRSPKDRRLGSCDSCSSPTSTFSVSDGASFSGLASPKRSWFTNLFKFRPAYFSLNSVHDVSPTLDVCRRLLADIGVRIVSHVEDVNGGSIRCQLHENRDSIGLMSVARPLKFRVEARILATKPGQAKTEYNTLIDVVLEKGPLSSFRLLQGQIRREWDLDSVRDEGAIGLYSPTSVRDHGEPTLPVTGRFTEEFI